MAFHAREIHLCKDEIKLRRFLRWKKKHLRPFSELEGKRKSKVFQGEVKNGFKIGKRKEEKRKSADVFRKLEKRGEWGTCKYLKNAFLIVKYESESRIKSSFIFTLR